MAYRMTGLVGGALLCAAALAVAAPARASQTERPASDRGARAQGLSEEQRQKVTEILRRTADRRRELAREAREDVNRLLTPEQRQRMARSARLRLLVGRARLQAGGARTRPGADRDLQARRARSAAGARWLRGLGLTPEQRERIRDIRRQQAQATRERVLNVLTPEQRRRVEELRARRPGAAR